MVTRATALRPTRLLGCAALALWATACGGGKRPATGLPGRPSPARRASPTAPTKPRNAWPWWATSTVLRRRVLALVPDAQGVFRGHTTLGAGRYGYRFWVDGAQQLDPHNPLTPAAIEPRRHGSQRAQSGGLPAAHAHRAKGRKRPRALRPPRAVRRPRPDRAALDPAAYGATIDHAPLAVSSDPGRATLRIEAALGTGKHHLRLFAKDVKGREARAGATLLGRKPHPSIGRTPCFIR